MKVYVLMQLVQESADYHASYLDSIHASKAGALKELETAKKLNLGKHTTYEIEEHIVEASK